MGKVRLRIVVRNMSNTQIANEEQTTSMQQAVEIKLKSGISQLQEDFTG